MVGASFEVMNGDTERLHGELPDVSTNMKPRNGIEVIVELNQKRGGQN